MFRCGAGTPSGGPAPWLFPPWTMPSPPVPQRVTDVPRLAPRPADANKGDFGRILVVAGSRGMSGAAVLCGSAALRGGAGLVRLAVAEGILPLVAPGTPCCMTAPLPQDEHGRLAESARDDLLALIRANTVTALGPGLGQSDGLRRLLAAVLEQTTAPLVLDADALNNLAHDPAVLRRHAGPLLLTPHPGEFSRLLGSDIPTVQAHREELAVRFAAEHGVVLVLKGHRTMVTDGGRLYLNTTGNPGMATGGSGDVLTGLLAALTGAGLETFAAARLGVYLHGLAGDLARDALGETSLIASDLIDFLPRAFQAHARGEGQT
jgi:ADP-dependent NAD(P)H-hydrate dehydratase